MGAMLEGIRESKREEGSHAQIYPARGVVGRVSYKNTWNYENKTLNYSAFCGFSLLYFVLCVSWRHICRTGHIIQILPVWDILTKKSFGAGTFRKQELPVTIVTMEAQEATFAYRLWIRLLVQKHHTCHQWHLYN